MGGLSDSETETEAIEDLDYNSTDWNERYLNNLSSLNSNNNSSGLIAEIEKLVETVVPDEIDNIDEILIQFRGREEKLLETLETMRDKNLSEGEFYTQLELSSNSKMSLFERDRQFSRSSMAQSIGNMFSASDSEDDMITPEEMQLCSECGNRMPKSEFREEQLEIPISATC